MPFPSQPQSPLGNIPNGDLETVRQQVVRVAQIIRAALIMGVLMFGGITIITTPDQPPEQPLVALVGAGFAVLATAARAIVVPIFASVQRRKIVSDLNSKQFSPADANRVGEEIEKLLYVVWQTKLILEAAILEGAAFLNLIACIVEHQWWSLAVAASLLASMVVSFPTRCRAADWVRSQSELIELDRVTGGTGRE